MASLPPLPTEVWEGVIDSMPQISMYWSLYVRTLCSCALTCRAWTPRSRVCLYRNIRFDQGGRGIEQSVHKLERTMVAQPYLSRLIEQVDIVTPGLAIVPVGSALQNVAVMLAGKLPNLKSLSFTVSTYTNRREYWVISMPGEVLHRAFFAAMRTFPQLVVLELTRMSFQTVNDLLRMLSALHALQALSVVGVELIRESTDPYLTLRLPSITFLTVGGAHEAWPLSPSVTNLTWTLIKLLAPTLRNLSLCGMSTKLKEIVEKSEIIRLPQLVSLTMHFQSYPPGEVLAAFLSQTETPLLTDLDYHGGMPLRIFLDPDRREHRLSLYGTEAAMEKVNGALESVNIVYRLTQGGSVSAEIHDLRSAFGLISTQVLAACRDIRRAYPRLSKCGALRITFVAEAHFIVAVEQVGEPLQCLFFNLTDGECLCRFEGRSYGEEVAPGTFCLPRL